MDKLFYNLPEELQDKIRRMNKHPVAELFYEAVNLESYYYDRCGDHSNDIWYKIKVVSVLRLIITSININQQLMIWK